MPEWAFRFLVEVSPVECTRVQSLTDEQLLAAGFLGINQNPKFIKTEFKLVWDQSHVHQYRDNPHVLLYHVKLKEFLNGYTHGPGA